MKVMVKAAAAAVLLQQLLALGLGEDEDGGHLEKV
jgi:hypothetical protein